MNNQQNNTPSQEAQNTPIAKKGNKAKKPVWLRILKWISIIVFTLLLLISGAISLVLWYLTPEKLTPIVNEYAGDFLDADIKIERVELTFWSTFPRLNLQVDSLEIISHSLNAVKADTLCQLPADVDSLLQIERVSGGIDISALSLGNIELYDLELTNPRVNIVIINDSINNFNIVPLTDTPEEASEPFDTKISFNRFELIGSMPIRYRMPADSIDATLTIDRTELNNSTAPLYKLNISGNTGLEMADLNIPSVPFSITGNLNIDINNPQQVSLSEFSIEMLGLQTIFNTDITLAPELCINKFDISFPDIDVAHIIELMPSEQIGMLRHLDTDLLLNAKAELLEPYALSSATLPKAKVDIGAKARRLRFQQMNLSKINFEASSIIDAANFNRSTIAINHLEVVGHAMDFSAQANISTPISDPNINGTFSGSISFERLPAILLNKLPMSLHGKLHGETDFKFRLSQLTPNKFHHAKLNGKVTLCGFKATMNDNSGDAFIQQAELKFGTSSSINTERINIDSLLTASLNIDTVSCNIPGLEFAGRNLFAGIGMRNVASSSDTTQINPIGGTIRADMISLKADSPKTRIRLREATIGAALQRYNNETRSPQLNLDISARRMSYFDATTRASISKAKASLQLHPRKRQSMPQRMRARFDSIKMANPGLSTDSLRMLAQGEISRKRFNAKTDRENIEFELDSSLTSWLQLWRLTGSMSAERARCFTAFYPTNTTLTGLDFKFSTDSVRVRNARLKTGKSDFTINGSINNIRRALTSRRHTPIEVNLSLRSDTIDVNDLTATLLRGAAYSTSISDSTLMNDADEDFESIIPEENTADSVLSAIVIPSNVNANLRVSAKKICYADMWLSNFGGSLSIYDGALSMNNLHAKTELGSLNMSAMYSAPTRKDLSFATGISITKLNLRKLLGMMPQIDSLMPMLSNVEGIVDAHIALTTDLDSAMNIDFNSLDMALKLTGDSLVLLDSETFRTISKWLMFKNKNRNMIEHLEAEVMIHDGWLDLYPMMFEMDRYRLGIAGNNDLNLNLDYHIAVIKSPLPFKFGINVKGTPEDMKISLGKARLNENSVAEQRNITDTTRVNLLSEIQRAFRRGVRTAGTHGLRIQQERRRPMTPKISVADDTLSAADSAVFIREGLIKAPTPAAVGSDSLEKTPQKEESEDKHQKGDAIETSDKKRKS